MSVDDLSTILSDYVPKGKKVVETKSSALVAPGENYGAELLRLDVVVEDEQTKEKSVVHAVGKKIPALEYLQKNFNVQVTFKSEMLFYQKIVPLMQEFQRKNGVKDVIDCFVKFYGGRINLNGSDVVDRDAIMVMENLVVAGYKNLDRHVGYNLEETKMLLKDLANLHSTVLAIKLKDPDTFRKEIRPLCNNDLSPPEDVKYEKIILLVRDILLKNNETAPYVPKIMEIWYKYGDKYGIYKAREPFATISHCDLWVNNAMMKYENGKPVKNIFLDFQLYSYRSPVFDLLNFLVTSVQTSVLKTEFDSLIKFYHTEFVNNLRKLGCDTKPFGFDEFLEEIKIDSPHVLVWALLFIPMIVFGQKQSTNNKPVEVNNGTKVDPLEKFVKQINNLMPEARERLYCFVESFGKRGWTNYV